MYSPHSAAQIEIKSYIKARIGRGADHNKGDRVLVCVNCGRGGGTLMRVGENRYRHQSRHQKGCPNK